MKKNKKDTKCLLLLLFAILFMGIGFARISDVEASIEGKSITNVQKNVFITDVIYKNSSSEEVLENSKIKHYEQTTVNSEIALSKTDGNSSITYEIKLYNNSETIFAFDEAIYDEEFYSNENIVFALNGLKNGDMIQPKEYLTFEITFSYKNKTVPSNNILDSWIKFKFKISTIEYNIEYTLNGGTLDISNPTTYTVETSDFTLNNPTKTGYTFKGWSGTDLTGDTNTSVTIIQGSTGERSYTANWTANIYDVKFNSNDGSDSVTTQVMTYDTPINLMPNNFMRTGYTFKEWNTKPDGSGISYTNGQEVSNLTDTNGATFNLYAQWEEERKIPKGLEVGSVVSYNPSGSYVWEAEYYSSKKTPGTDDVFLHSGTATVGAEEKNMSVTKWRVLSINEDTGEVELVPNPIAKQNLSLEGAQGYNNGVKLLNDACDALYSSEINGKKIKARSLNREDVLKYMTEDGKNKINNSSGYGSRESSKLTNYPVIFGQKELNVVVEDKTRLDATLGLSEQESLIKRSEGTSTSITNYIGMITGAEGYQPYNTYYSIDVRSGYFMGDYYDILYAGGPHHLATRCQNGGNFRMCKMDSHLAGMTVAYSKGSGYERSFGLCPIVSLDASLISVNEKGEFEVNLE